MKINIYLLSIILFLITGCQQNEVIKTHGIAYLEKREKLITVKKSNKNDIIAIMGQPSTKGMVNDDLWIYIERKQTQSELKNLGRMKIYKNDVLVLEINEYGILKSKKFYNKNDMEKIKIVEETTQTGFTKTSFIYDFLSSMRQKINDPLGVRVKKREEISQR